MESLPNHLRLCLVAVKRFSENTYFPKMLISGKGKCFHGFWLHFKKFSGKYFLVFGKEEGKHKSRKTQATTQEKIINDDTEHCPTTIDGAIAISPSLQDCDRRRDLAKARSRSSRDRAVDRDLDPVRSHEGEIAIDGKIAIFVRSRHQLRSRSGAISRRRDRDQRRLECLPTRLRSARTGDRALSLSLSLSLSSFFGNTLKGK